MKNKQYSLCAMIAGLVVLIVPLIVFMKFISLSGDTFDFWTGITDQADFFSYYKSIWLMIFTLACVILFFYYIIKSQINFKDSLLYIPLGVYALFAILSTVLSKHQFVSLWGFTDRYEGLFVLLCYMALCFICSFAVFSKDDIKLVLSFLLISMVIICFIGISQFWSFDIIQSEIGKRIILPKEFHNIVNTLKFNFPERFIYATLYNPNYVGTYFSMLFPISLSLFILANTSTKKVLFGILSVLSFVNLIGCLSNTGYIAAGIACFVLVVFLRKQVLKNRANILVLFFCLVSTLLFMNFTTDNTIFREFGLSGKQVPTNITQPENTGTKSTDVLTDIDIVGSTASLYFNKEVLTTEYVSSTHELRFYDGNKNVVAVTLSNDSGKYIFKDKRFESISLETDGRVLKFNLPGSSFVLSLATDSVFKVYSQTNKLVDFTKAESIGFSGKELWASSRGYIWSRTFPLLKDVSIIGHGPDTYAIYFPQNDFSGKFKYLGNMYMLVDKPHNMFLQMWLNTGSVSMLAFLVFVLLYFVQCCRLYLTQSSDNEYYIFGITCMVAVVGFLVSGIANDSNLSVSPVFWILLGLGIGCNRLFKGFMLQSTVEVKITSKEGGLH